MTVTTPSPETLEPEANAEEYDHRHAQKLWSIPTPDALMTYFDDDRLEISFTPGTHLTVSKMQGLLEQLSAYRETTPGHLLISISGIGNAEMDVARIFDKVTRGSRVALLGSGPADRVLARFFMRKLHSEELYVYVEQLEEATAFLFAA